MPPPPKSRKFRKPGPGKNQLKAARNSQQQESRAQAGLLGDRFPDVAQVNVECRMETAAGAVLLHEKRTFVPADPILLNVSCEGGCGNGLFLLQDVIDTALRDHQERREGLGICQAVSYSDSKMPCSTKLYYSIEILYK